MRRALYTDTANPKRMRRYPVIITTTLFALFLWLSVTMNAQYTWTFTLPIKIAELPRNMALSSPPPHAVGLVARGSGWELVGMSLLSHPRAQIYLSEAPATTTRIILGRDPFVHVEIPSGVQILSIVPDTLFLNLEPMVQKRVPLVPQLSLKFRKGFGIAGTVTVDPDSVTLSGSRTVLQNITQWKTNRIELNDVHTSISVDVAPSDPTSGGTSLVSVSPHRAHIMVPVDLMAEKEWKDVPVEVVGVPPGREVLLYPPTLQVILRGGATRIGSISSDEVNAQVLYSTLLRDTVGLIEPTVRYPSDVQLVSIKPQQLQFVIRLKAPKGSSQPNR